MHAALSPLLGKAGGSRWAFRHIVYANRINRTLLRHVRHATASSASRHSDAEERLSTGCGRWRNERRPRHTHVTARPKNRLES